MINKLVYTIISASVLVFSLGCVTSASATQKIYNHTNHAMFISFTFGNVLSIDANSSRKAPEVGSTYIRKINIGNVCSKTFSDWQFGEEPVDIWGKEDCAKIKMPSGHKGNHICSHSGMDYCFTYGWK